MTSFRSTGRNGHWRIAAVLLGVIVLLLCAARAGAVDVFEYPLPAGSQPLNLAVGPGNELWITDQGRNAIDRMSTIGQVTGVFEAGMPAAATPWQIVRGPDGNMWFTMLLHAGIGRITPSGELLSIPTASETVGITSGPDGRIWFTERGQAGIFSIDPATLTVSSIPVVGAEPGEIVVGGNGDLWFTDFANEKVGMVPPGGGPATEVGPVPESSCSAFHGENPCPELEHLGVGPDGSIWYTEFDGKAIGHIPLTTLSPAEFTSGLSDPSGLGGITAGPDGNMWFTERDSNRIGWVTSAGVITEDSALSASAVPVGITAGPDSNLWFTESATGRIGMAIPNVPPVATTSVATSVTATEAVVNGAVRPRGAPTSVVFQFGHAPYEATTPATSAGESDQTLGFEGRLTGLRPSTTYHFRFVATNTYGQTAGSDLTFTTVAAPPPPPKESVGRFKMTLGSIRRSAHGLRVRHVYVTGVASGDRVGFVCHGCSGKPKSGSHEALSTKVGFKLKRLTLTNHSEIVITVTDREGGRRVRRYRFNPRHQAEAIVVKGETCLEHGKALSCR